MNNDTLYNSGRLLIKLINCGIKDRLFDEIEKIEDWEQLILLANTHSVSNLLLYALKYQMEFVPEEIRQKLYKIKKHQIYIDAHQEYAANLIVKMFESNKIDYMFLKGYHMKRLYPSQDMRSMSDIDILIHDYDEQKLIKLIEKSNFEIRSNKADELKLFLAPVTNIEIHKMLVEYEWKEFYEYYKDGWKVAKKSENHDNMYIMIDEDFYVFHIVHLIRHYIFAGTGIRSFLDVYIYLEKKSKTLDMNYINDQFKKMNIYELAENVRKLAYAWFGNGQHSELTKEMEEYVFSSGIYGNLHNREVRETIKKKEYPLNYYIKQLFPGKIKMSSQYPLVNKYSALMPVFWTVRIIQAVFLRKNRENLKRILNSGRSIDNDNIEKLKKHYKKIGVNIKI